MNLDYAYTTAWRWAQKYEDAMKENKRLKAHFDEIESYAGYALGIISDLEYNIEEDGMGEFAGCLNLDWFYHVKWKLQKILQLPPNNEKPKLDAAPELIEENTILRDALKSALLRCNHGHDEEQDHCLCWECEDDRKALDSQANVKEHLPPRSRLKNKQDASGG